MLILPPPKYPDYKAGDTECEEFLDDQQITRVAWRKEGEEWPDTKRRGRCRAR